MRGVRTVVLLSLGLAAVTLLSLAVGCGGPKVTISTPTISAARVAPGDPVSIAVNVLNSGKKAVEYKVELKVNDAIAESQDVTVDAGATLTVDFKYAPAAIGSYKVDVNGQVGTFDAVKPASFAAGTLSFAPDPPLVGREVQVSTQVKNEGDLAGTCSACLKVNGKEMSTTDIPLAAGASSSVTAAFTPDVNGMVVVEFAGVTQSVKVLKPAEFRTTAISVKPGSVLTGQTASVEATITNSGEVKDTCTVPLKVNGTEAGSRSITLEPGASASVSFSVTRDTAGSCSISVLGSSSTLTVIELKKYANTPFFYTISYPPGYTVDDDDRTSVLIGDGKSGGIAVLVDRVPITMTPQEYFDAIAQGKKKEFPDWTATSVAPIAENGVGIGYKYDYTNTVNGVKWVGKGVIVKKVGYGYYAVFTTKETEWGSSKAIASRCVDTFTSPKVSTGSYADTTLGLALTTPPSWNLVETGTASSPLYFSPPYSQPQAVGQLYVETVPAGTTAQQYTEALAAQLITAGYSVGQPLPFAFTGGVSGREVSATASIAGESIKYRVIALINGTRAYALLFSGRASSMDTQAAAIAQLSQTLSVSTPSMAGVNKNETLFMLAGEIPTLDPAMTEEPAGDTVGAIFGGLVKLDKDLKIVGDLAERWTVSADGKTYTFYLRANARFHDGTAVTAADVKYSWERACDPALKSPKANYFLNDIVGAKDRMDGKTTAISGVKVVDERTLEVTLDAAKQYFLDKLAQPVAFVVDRDNVAKGAKWYEQPNGTGPFKLKTWEKDSLLVLERFDGYHLGAAKLKNLVFKLFAGYSMQLYESGEIDVTGVGTSDLDRVLDTSNPLNRELLTGSSLSIYYLGFNVSKPPFDDPKVRQAFAMAIDVSKVIEVALKGRADPAAGYLVTGIPGFDSALQPLPFDPARAKQLIAESKYQSVDKLPAITLFDYGSAGAAEQAIIGMWQQNLGVQVKVDAVTEITTYMNRMRNEDFQVHLGGWIADYVDAQNFLEVLFQSQSNENHFAYFNPAVDAALVLAAAEPNETARNQKYRDIEKLILADLPAAPLYRNSRQYVLVKPYVKGYVLTPISVNIWAEISVVAH